MRVVIKDEVGLLIKSSTIVGVSASASGKVLWKNAVMSSRVCNEANDGAPSNGKNKVQVKLPSILGKAMSM